MTLTDEKLARKLRPERAARIARQRLLAGDTGQRDGELMCGGPKCLHHVDLVNTYREPCAECGLHVTRDVRGKE